jgi:hypothetical protein
MNDLQNSTSLSQKIVVNSIFSIIEILTVEDQKFYDTFLHVAFESQNMLKLTNDQTDSDTNQRIR